MKIIISIIILALVILCLHFVLSKKEKFVLCSNDAQCVSDLGPGNICKDGYCSEQNTTSVSNLSVDNQMGIILSKLQGQKSQLNSLRTRVM
jgi:hypothetical protein